ncbi:MAG: SHOCT domain-containing protein [Hydrogenovibrio sp.]|uniref:SHOCT domain-containing protein n=1 Tax=Hydrogenovibrio sp. TaxID=2065821 RepID=UPI0028709FBF|nr:SHOCT domain-containing protein [Hydrogenovibrio sp.]MDR9497751.1 SHOCT domain-containing protein [Hydrogenovibrio sp.]
MNWEFGSMHGFGGGGMWFFWLILLVVIVFLIKAFMNQSGDSQTPMEILEKRFAKGEITQEQFEEQKRILQSK